MIQKQQLIYQDNDALLSLKMLEPTNFHWQVSDIYLICTFLFWFSSNIMDYAQTVKKSNIIWLRRRIVR